MTKKTKQTGPKILLLDIETAPILGYVWSIWEENMSLNQIQSDWHILSWSAKWLDSNKVMYMDQRNKKDITNDKVIMEQLWKLMDEADILVTQNGKKFDEKRINTRFLMHGMKPPKDYRHIDTLQIARKKFGFTSNKLEFLTKSLKTKVQKLKHKKFPGFELWSECLKNNPKAWREMETYNKADVLSLQELYLKLIPWDNSINFSVYNDNHDNTCSCGNTQFIKNGYRYTTSGKFQRYTCTDCGKGSVARSNLISKDKRKNLNRS